MKYEDIDMAAIEAEARKLRAQVMAEFVSGVAVFVKSLISKATLPENLGGRKIA